ncbi:MAG: DUF4160 domain-containing protein [Bacteroidota bacterium]
MVNFVVLPKISWFYGIIVLYVFDDQNLSHFKVKYAEFEANILIENGSMLNGDIPLSKYNKLVIAWARIHKEALLIMYDSKIFIKLNSSDNERRQSYRISEK